MFIDVSYEELLAEYLSYASEEIDTRQGSVYYDAGAGFLLLLSRFYTDLNHLYDMISLTSAAGEYLDDKGRDFGVERKQATYARYAFSYELYENGTAPALNERFFTDGQYFVAAADGESFFLQAETAGSGANGIAAGTRAIPVETIAGLKSVSFGAIRRYGTDIESDDTYRERIREKLSGPAENGNRQHYKTWCGQFEGVGAARIIPLDNGPNSVTGVILDEDGNAAGNDLTQRIQEYIDPNRNGDGSGVANIGAVFTAVAPEKVVIDISFTSVKEAEGYSREQVKSLVTAAIKDYFKQCNLNSGDASYDITPSKLGAAVITLPCVDDYSSLSLFVSGAQQAAVRISNGQYASPGDSVELAFINS